VDRALATVALDLGQNPLSLVVFGTVAFSLLMSLLFLATRGSGNMYDHIGQGGFSSDGEHTTGRMLPPETGSMAASAEQELEIRQMLRARSDRMVSRGEPALDVEAELARLLAPTQTPGKHDAGLVEEVRQLVVARNERRVRQGQEPLDEDAEVQRTLAEMEP
jgi:hypothetical protein